MENRSQLKTLFATCIFKHFSCCSHFRIQFDLHLLSINPILSLQKYLHVESFRKNQQACRRNMIAFIRLDTTPSTARFTMIKSKHNISVLSLILCSIQPRYYWIVKYPYWIEIYTLTNTQLQVLRTVYGLMCEMNYYCTRTSFTSGKWMSNRDHLVTWQLCSIHLHLFWASNLASIQFAIPNSYTLQWLQLNFKIRISNKKCHGYPM